MPTNVFFQGGKGIGSKSEQDLMQQITNEIIQMAGADFVYIPRDLVKLDELFHEDTLAKFTKNFTVEMYIDNYQEFLGAGDQISKFGFQLNDQMKLFVSRERFSLIVNRLLPKEGDLVFYPISNHIFEIKYVDDKNPLYPLGTRNYFALTCEAIKYSHETIDTGTTVDELETVIGSDGTIANDLFDKASSIETEADSVQDFTESNPFGDI